MVKNLPAKAGDVQETGSITGEGNGNLLQYSCLENPGTEESGGLQSLGPQQVGHD